MTLTEEKEKRVAEVQAAAVTFAEKLDIDLGMGQMLASEGMLNLEDIAYCDVSELLSIGGMEEDVASELQSRARDALLNQALSDDQEEATDPLDTLDGMNSDIKSALLAQDLDDLVKIASLADGAVVEGVTPEDLQALVAQARTLQVPQEEVVA